MTIAKKGNRLVVKRGLLARNCQCCRPNNTCGVTCPQSLEDIAADITLTLTINSITEYGSLRPAPFQNGDVFPCAFSRMQSSGLLSPQQYAVYSSNDGISQSIGTPALTLSDGSYTSELLSALQSMQAEQELIEVGLPCNEQTTFTSNKFVIIRMYSAWNEPFAIPFKAQVFLSNLEPQLSSGRPLVNCQLALSPPVIVQGYSVRIPQGLAVDASFVGLQLQVNPLP